MLTAAFLVRARRLLVVRVLAAVLVALAISPVTAPFAALDVFELTGDGPSHHELTGAKSAKDLGNVSALLAGHASMTVACVVAAVTSCPVPTVLSFRSVVLRI